MLNHNSQEGSNDSGIQSTYNEYVKGTNVLPYLLAILQDCKDMNMHYGEAEYLRDRETLTRRYIHEGLSFATKTLPSLFDNLLVFLETGTAAYPSFRLCKGRNYPIFLWQLFKPIHDDPSCETAVTCMRSLYQLCVAFKKLKGPYKTSVLVKQLDDFISTDANLEKDFNVFEASSYTLTVLGKARRIIEQVVQGLNPFDVNQSEMFLPRPGPGATNSKVEKHERYRPHMFDAQIAELFGYEEWYNPPLHPPRGKRPWDLRVGKSKCNLPKNKRNLLTSRFEFVHKTFGKARGICIEQLEMQWLQQAVRRGLYDCIEAHPLTSGYVSFRNQTVNGLLALQASRDRKLATLDMSEASDRILRLLVSLLWCDNKELLKALMCLATRYVELPKALTKRKWLKLNKYAPMGSALCFPVMGLCHFALVKAIISMGTSRHINDIPVYVYGDDIIVEAEHARTVMEELPTFGMKMNVKKSFYKSLFRESCGVHAYNGTNITPVRFKSIVRSNSSTEDIVGLLKNESALFKRGFKNTAMFVRNEFLKVPTSRANSYPIVGPKSNILGWIREYTDASKSLRFFCKRRRWNSHYQQFEYKVRSIVGLYDDSPPLLDDGEGYLRQLVTRSATNESDSKTMNGSPRGSRIRWAWHTDSDLGYTRDTQRMCRIRLS